MRDIYELLKTLMKSGPLIRIKRMDEILFKVQNQFELKKKMCGHVIRSKEHRIEV